jgi:hypothetical protein
MALGLLLVLSGIVALAQSRGFGAASSGTVEREQAYAKLMLDGILHREIDRILHSTPIHGHPAESRQPLALEDLASPQVLVTTAMEDGRVDLNAAPPDLIRAALLADGVGGAAAEEVVSSILTLRREGAALSGVDQSLPVQQRLVEGNARDAFSSLTTLTARRTIDPVVAGDKLLAALPGIPDSIQNQITAQRQGRLVDQQIATGGGAWRAWFQSGQDTITVTASTQLLSGTWHRRVVSFRIDRGRSAISYLRWRSL